MPSPAKYPANRTGLPFGQCVVTDLGFPARVAGKSDALRTFVEVYGESHESGYESTNSLQVISPEEFAEMCLSLGHDPDDIHDPRLRRWQRQEDGK